MAVEIKRLLPPDVWIKRQIGNLEAVGEANFREGIKRPKKHTIEEGIKAEKKYAEQLKKAIAEERRAKALKVVTLDEWYGYTEEIGAPRLVEGVVKRKAEVDKFVTKWQPILLEHVKKIDAMPEVTDPERERRMLENLRGLKALKGTWRGT